MNLQTRLLPIFFLLPLSMFADDLYLTNGLLYRNVLIADTTGTVLNIIRDSVRTGIRLELIEKIEKRQFVPHQKSTREVYSQSKFDEYAQLQLQKALPQKEKQKPEVEDSTQINSNTLTVSTAVGAYSASRDRLPVTSSAIDFGIMARYAIYHPIVIRVRLGNNPVNSKMLFDPQIGVSWRYFEYISGLSGFEKPKKPSYNVRIGSVTGFMFEFGRYHSLPLISGGGFGYTTGIGFYDDKTRIGWWFGFGDLVQAESIQIKYGFPLLPEYRGTLVGGVAYGVTRGEFFPGLPSTILGCSISFDVERDISIR